MATSKITKDAILSKASDWNDAYAKAKSRVVVVGKATIDTNNIALTLEIPKSAVDVSASRYWQVSDGYGSSGHTHLQVFLNGTAFGSAAIYTAAGTSANPQEITYYYD